MKTWTVSGVIKLVLTSVIAALVALLGGWDKGIQILLVFVVLDIVSGIVRAIIQKKLSSDESYKGGLRKILIFVVVAIGTQVDKYAETNLARNLVIAYYVASEALSVLENVVASGVPVPPALKAILAALSKEEFPTAPDPPDE